MHKSSKALLLAFIVLAGLFASYRFIPETNNFFLSSVQKDDSKYAQLVEDPKSGYFFSSPSNGSVAKTKKISITHNSNNTATATIKNDTFSLRTEQEVILYTEENKTIPFPGKISDIKDDGKHSTITIDIPKQIKDVLKIDNISNKAEIIIFTTVSSQRYPYSALQKDKNGNYFVWTLEKSKDETSNTHKVNKTWIDTPTLGSKYFVAGRPISAFSFVILNPDNRLQDGKNYIAFETAFKAPIYSGHKQALQDYKKELIEKENKKMQQKIEDCNNNKASSDPSRIPGASCGDNNVNRTTNDIIKYLLSN